MIAAPVALLTLLALLTVTTACGDDDAGDAAAGDAGLDSGGGSGTNGGGSGTNGGDAGPGDPPSSTACAKCDPSADCDARAATPHCTCPAGFEHEGDERSACVDVDECELGEDDCDGHASCTNTEGSYECECDDGYSGDGQDCEDIDECEDDPCDSHASCDNTPGSYECECDDGFTGDGEDCEDIDECEDDPCDDDATCDNTPGGYDCECDEPLVGNGKECACDLTGTFAALAEVDVAWDEVKAGDNVLISAGSDTTKSWSIRRQVQDGDEIVVEITPCGGTSSDLCSPYYDAAYGQYVPDATWEADEMPTFSSVMDVPDPDPDDDFVGPLEVAMTGLELDDAFGDWPQSQDDEDFTWVDHDGDDGDYASAPNLTPKPLGVTTIIRTTGNSTDCDNKAYKGLPIPPLGANLASVIMTGDRSVASLEGVIVSCDVMGGKLGGPDTCRGEDNDDDVPCFDGRLRNCVRTTGAACSGGEIDAFDDTLNEPGTRVLASRFVMERVDDDVTCADVRGHTFPPIPDVD
jgi:hypothetical protein